ncbi:hypothetical protein CYMTET_32752 [Cymbomonas tetramitiformis]|uniref:Uncharacterized protein n=1 Tax=Cymbomonas tetramitiformis TaxID=36881 RepID=A0AAE0FE73_9CHLO|nr:hypothetical protein CYMTET_32752 [Cymbomonas tetramitiformis]
MAGNEGCPHTPLFSGKGVENSVFAARFQRAIDDDNSEEFDALFILAGGKPDIVADLSACSLCEDDGERLVSAIDRRVHRHCEECRQRVKDALHINTFTARNDMSLPVVPAATRPSTAASVELRGGVDGSARLHPFMPQPVTRTFADFIGGTGFTVGTSDSEPHANMNMISAVAQPAHSDGYATTQH